MDSKPPLHRVPRQTEWHPFRPSEPESLHRSSAPGILLADDDAAVRSLLEVALRQHGFAVWAAANGQEALELFRCHQAEISAVLLDVRMPCLDGPETLAAMQAADPTVCCCYMTGDSGGYTSEELLASGAVCVFKKPFRLGEIVSALERLAGKESVSS
jgi:CheY-like chemotaxis protein